MPGALRRLFATLLHYYRPANPRVLFDRYYIYLAEYFSGKPYGIPMATEDVLHKVLQGIHDTLESLRRDVNHFHLVDFRYSTTEFEKYTREVEAEKSIPVTQHLDAMYQLNREQRQAFDMIFTTSISGKGSMFFIDGPGGTGKRFLYQVLLAHVRSRGEIGIGVASSGFAASQFLGGRTAHSRFKIPTDGGPNVKCLISLQSAEAELLCISKIIIWDKAPMADKLLIRALDKLLQDICENTKPFGDKLVVLGGDFRQVFPVIKGGTRQQQIDASIVCSDIWNDFTKIRLVDNIQARNDPGYINFLMRMGDGREPTNTKGEVLIPKPMGIPYTSFEQSLEVLIQYVYPDLALFKTHPYEMMQRTILCPKNEFVDDVNNILIQLLPGKESVYISDDRGKSFPDQGDYVDYLNSLQPLGLPQHTLILKEDCPIILLRNINPVEGLCNGTRLICKTLKPNVLGTVIATGQFKGKHVWIPRIPLEANHADNKYMVPFVRRQIPVRLCFAMTINKSQGRTLDYVGIYMKQSVFHHGQLYVALSRARSVEKFKVLIFVRCTTTMLNQMILIADINKNTKHQACVTTLSEDLSVINCGNGIKMKRYIFIDMKGNEITAYAYGHHMNYVCLMLQQLNVYEIPNAQVVPVEHRFRIVDNPSQWRLQKETLILKLKDDAPTLKYFLKNIKSFDEVLTSTTLQGNTVDIMVIVVSRPKNQDESNVARKNNVVHYTLLGLNKKKIILCIWEDMIQAQGETMKAALETCAVTVAKRVRVGMYKGSVVVTTKPSSSLSINPPLLEAESLKSCFTTINEDELDHILQQNTENPTKERVDAGIDKVYTVQKLQQQIQLGAYWIRGFLNLEEDQMIFHYKACNKCHAKTTADLIQAYTCNSCKKRSTTIAKLIVIMTITDHNGTMKTVAIEQIAEKILAIGEPTLQADNSKATNVNRNKVKTHFNNKYYLILLRRTFGETNEAKRRHLLLNITKNLTLRRKLRHYHQSIMQKTISVPTSPRNRRHHQQETNRPHCAFHPFDAI